MIWNNGVCSTNKKVVYIYRNLVKFWIMGRSYIKCTDANEINFLFDYCIIYKLLAFVWN